MPVVKTSSGVSKITQIHYMQYIHMVRKVIFQQPSRNENVNVYYSCS